jgi:hypothetical protein
MRGPLCGVSRRSPIGVSSREGWWNRVSAVEALISTTHTRATVRPDIVSQMVYEWRLCVCDPDALPPDRPRSTPSSMSGAGALRPHFTEL